MVYTHIYSESFFLGFMDVALLLLGVTILLDPGFRSLVTEGLGRVVVLPPLVCKMRQYLRTSLAISSFLHQPTSHHHMNFKKFF